MSSQHNGKFTWGVGPERVCVSGNFNNWSDTATPLHKQADGSFAADVPLPWGEKQPFKYVVDGEWKVREDEAKEWDAAGNMNNVYTAPHAPSPAEDTPAPAPAPAPAAAAAASTESAPAPSVPSPSTADNDPISATQSTNSNTLLAAAIPTAGVPAAAGGSEPVLGNTRHITGNEATDSGPAPAEAQPSTVGVPAAAGGSEPVLGNIRHIASQPNTDPSTAAPGNTAPIVNTSSPEAIQKVAANANIGQEATQEEKTFMERAQQYGAGAAVTLGAALGQAAHVVEDVTGVNLTHGAPLTVEEAKARGIDIENAENIDAATDATSPVGQAPPKDAVADLAEKTRELRVDDGATATAGKPQVVAVPLPGGEAPKTMTASESSLPKPTANDESPKHDLPAQNETSENHTHVPAPAIVAISARDPTKDRTLDAPASADTTGTKPISTDPAVDPAQAKKEAEQNPALTGSTPLEAKSSDKTNLESEDGVGQRPDAPEANFDAPPPAKKDIAPGQAAPAPAPVSKDAPSTPAKTNGGGSASAASTPASTPAKSTHDREATNSSDVKKRKSGFLHKFKSAFSPKDKEKK